MDPESASNKPLERCTATELHQLLREDAITVVDIVEALFRRIEVRDSKVKAWAFLDRDLVVRRARELDALPREERGPLHGIPIGIKDCIYTKDMPTQHNSPIYKDSHPELDANCVLTCRSLGALIFGKTETCEFAATNFGPRTSNAHDSTRTPGGSSSGSAAAVADFQCPVSFGTQTGGSVIRPASFNGVFAMKPTWGRISREGLKQFSPLADTLGIYARSIADLRLFVCDTFRLYDDLKIDATKPFRLSGAKIGFCTNIPVIWREAGEGTVKAMDHAKQLLQEEGCEVQDLVMPEEFWRLREWQKNLLASDAKSSFLGDYLANKTLLHSVLQGHVENATNLSNSDIREANDNIATLRPKMDALLSQFDVVVTPSVPDEAPKGLETTGNAIFNGTWTALHTPVINIPGFAGQSNLPIGLSLVAPRYRDEHLLHVAESVAMVFGTKGGWSSSL
ncbi:amidase signature enzyme [Meredithblackwellia eburnea MCA 4105]